MLLRFCGPFGPSPAPVVRPSRVCAVGEEVLTLFSWAAREAVRSGSRPPPSC